MIMNSSHGLSVRPVVNKTATGIHNVKVSDNDTKRGMRYNLNGQAVRKGYKGIVIENRKKVIMK